MGNPTILSLLMMTLGLIAPSTGLAQAGNSIPEPVISPQLERRDVRIPKINASDIEVGVFTGYLSVQDFGADTSLGLRLGYHVSEDYFVEGMYGRSMVSDRSFRRLGIAVFGSEEVALTYYYLSIGYNLFPGEVFLGENWAMTSAVYLVGGVGNVNFNGENHTAFNFGIGVRALPTDWLSVRFEMRDHMFDSDLLGRNELKHNFETTLGLTAYF